MRYNHTQVQTALAITAAIFAAIGYVLGRKGVNPQLLAKHIGRQVR